MKKSRRIHQISKLSLKQLRDFFYFLRKKIIFGIGYLLFTLFLLSLPGQNFYQTLTFAYQKAVVRNSPTDEFQPAPYPILIGSYPVDLSGEGIIVIDVPSNVILYAKNSNLPLTPASTTKIMTAVIALENYHLEQILTVNSLNTAGATIGLIPGDKISVKNLLAGLLINSANDTAYVLADNFPGGINKFILKMNQKVSSLNLKNTHFASVSGLEEINNYTSALDLAYLTEYALNNPTFSSLVATTQMEIPDASQTKWFQLTNVNKLLGEIPGVIGVKTGYTEIAGECLVTLVQRGERKILTVVLKSNDRFGESAYLIDWAFNNYRWINY